MKHSSPRARRFRPRSMTAIISADVRADFENVYRALEKAYAERSDDWKDGEKGTAVKEWLDTLESFPENIVDVSLDEFIDELALEDLVGDDPRDDFKDVGKEPGEA